MRRNDRKVSEYREIQAIIEKCKICHVAMVDDGYPYVVPLNFGYELEENKLTLYFHSAKEGRKIDILQKFNSVCFEMACEGTLGHIENPCNSGYFFESIIGFGNVEFIEDIHEKCRILTLFVRQQSGQEFEFTENQAKGVCVYKIESTDFSGKKKLSPKEMNAK